MQKKLWK